MHEDRTPSYTGLISILVSLTKGAIGETLFRPNKLWESPPLNANSYSVTTEKNAQKI